MCEPEYAIESQRNEWNEEMLQFLWVILERGARFGPAEVTGQTELGGVFAWEDRGADGAPTSTPLHSEGIF